MTHHLPSLDALKTQAKALRQSLANQDHTVTHSQSLELLANQYGYANWNILHAKCDDRSLPGYTTGQKITGLYLGHPFTGTVISARSISMGVRHDLVIRFEEAIDVIQFESMSSFRKQIRARVNHQGVSFERTSDGTPHLQIDMKKLG